jgi:aspartyl-tRNA(Asn)/glutamyl-tRNA(Gln) amidotransferase subunit A
MSDLSSLTLKQSIDGLKRREFSAAELQRAVLDSIKRQNQELNAYLDYHPAVPSETFGGELAGIPIAVKDNFLTRDLVTTASSNVLRGYRPHYESTVTRKLREAGAWIVGKTNLDAWAHGSSTETSDFGPTKNPLNPQYVPGGSSGGSAAAVAANMCIAAIGSETSGSILGPAAWTGTVGLKPTYGRASRYGITAMGSSLDCPGPMTKTVSDAALLLELMAGPDPYDGTTSDRTVPKYLESIGQGIKGKKIGVIYESVLPDQSRSILDNLVEVLRHLGASVESATAMDPEPAIGMYAVIQRSEVSSNLARYDGLRYAHGREAFGAEAKRRIMLGTYTLSKGYSDRYYVQAQKVRTRFIQDFDRLFSQYDLLVSLSMPSPAPLLGESAKYAFFGEMVDKLAEPRAAAGLPAINVPCYRDPHTNLALGAMFIAPQFAEVNVLSAAYAFEQATDWNPWVRQEAA